MGIPRKKGLNEMNEKVLAKSHWWPFLCYDSSLLSIFFFCIKRRIRAVFAEKDIISWGRAEVVIKLIDRGHGVDDSVDAARNCGDLQRSLRYLQQECPLCVDVYPMSQVCLPYTSSLLIAQYLLSYLCNGYPLYHPIVFHILMF